MDMESIKFECEVLGNLVKKSLSLNPDEQVTKKLMLKLKKIKEVGYLINSPEAIVSSLSGLEHALNLEELILPGHAITDINVLFNMISLKFLDLRHNKIIDIRPIANLENLRILGIYANPIERVFFYTDNKTKISYTDILKRIRIKGIIPDSHMDDFFSIAFNPTKDNAKRVLMKYPKMLMFARNVLSPVEISDVLTEKLSGIKISNNYVIGLYKQGVFDSSSPYKFDSKKWNKKVKTLVMELKLF